MRLIFVVLIMVFAFHVSGQPMQEVEKLLQQKSMGRLTDRINNQPEGKLYLKLFFFRNVVGPYNAGVVDIQETVAATNDAATPRFNNYRIQVLANSDSICYYSLIQFTAGNEDSSRVTDAYTALDSLRNSHEFEVMENLYKQTYGYPLDKQDLFITSLRYGMGCGFTGRISEECRKFNYYVVNKQLDSMQLWLVSACPEKQLFALRGYRTLSAVGYKLTAEEKRLIAQTEQKNTMVSTCKGCLYETRSFQEVVAEINAIPKRSLKKDFAFYAREYEFQQPYNQNQATVK